MSPIISSCCNNETANDAIGSGGSRTSQAALEADEPRSIEQVRTRMYAVKRENRNVCQARPQEDDEIFRYKATPVRPQRRTNIKPPEHPGIKTTQEAFQKRRFTRTKTETQCKRDGDQQSKAQEAKDIHVARRKNTKTLYGKALYWTSNSNMQTK
jgi:hypothetical protein